MKRLCGVKLSVNRSNDIILFLLELNIRRKRNCDIAFHILKFSNTINDILYPYPVSFTP